MATGFRWLSGFTKSSGEYVCRPADDMSEAAIVEALRDGLVVIEFVDEDEEQETTTDD